MGQESGREVAFGIFLSSNSIQYFPVVKFIIAIFPSLAKIHCFPALKRFPTYRARQVPQACRQSVPRHPFKIC